MYNNKVLRSGILQHIVGGVLVAAVIAPPFGEALSANPASPASEVSPVFGIEQPPDRGAQRRPHLPGGKDYPFRTIDGSGNNLDDTAMGAALTRLRRLVSPDYTDSVSALAGATRKGPREISNIVAAQEHSKTNELGATDFLWQWGQFLDHDIDFTDGTDPPEPAAIGVPVDDQFFVPGSSIPFNRSLYDKTTGINGVPRQQLNEITAWIDASNVYGSDPARAQALQALDGTGRLLTSPGNLLPFNTAGLPNAGGSSDQLFLAGDVRANEQVGLTALHTLFVREHNRLAAEFAADHTDWEEEHIYEKARQLVGAMMQAITYREFLPALLGPNALAPYRGYRPTVNAGIANVFSTAAYRFGHSALSPVLLRIDAGGNEIPAGHLPLRNAFFAPHRITGEGGIDPILRGLASQACQSIDAYVIDDVRNFLFGDPGAGGFDLAALNIQRGRDHGLPDYNSVRRQLGLRPAASFADVTSDPALQARLAQAYSTVENMDAWAGGLAEDRLPRAHVGELVFTILKLQFEALRDGDRFWYERILTPNERRMVEGSRLSDIIRRNTDIGPELPDDVFHVSRKR